MKGNGESRGRNRAVSAAQCWAYGFIVAGLFLGLSPASAESVAKSAVALGTEVKEKGEKEVSNAAREPKLVVVIAVDQLRRDRLTLPTQGGLKRLVDKGRVFAAGELAHAVSTTCPGHAAILTGLNPEHHGIPNNTFYDRATGEVRYCVEDGDPSSRVLGGQTGRSPKNMQSTALGDWLKASNPASRVVAVAGKDRAAITMAGQGPDGVYWYDKDQGRFTTSGYYADVLPDYVERFNGEIPSVDGFMQDFPETWVHDEGSQRRDDYPGEDDAYQRISGHPVRQGSEADIGKQVYVSPFLDQATLALAQLLIEKEKLGQRSALDLLAISLSATDTLGHLYGPRSAEAEDALARLDVALGEFMRGLDQSVGEDNYWVVLTADHGVAVLPEFARDQGASSCPAESGRISPESLFLGLSWHMYKAFTWPFGNPQSLLAMGGGHLVVVESGLTRFGVTKQEVLAEAINYLEGLPEIERVWLPSDFAAEGSDLAVRIRRSWVEDRLGDLFVQVAEGCLVDAEGTTHGSPYDYDLEIPIVFMGPGIEPGRVESPAYSIDIAATLAHFLNVVPDGTLDGNVLDLGDTGSESLP